MSVETIATVAAVVVSAIAVCGVLFQAGSSWSTLGWLKSNAATKADVKLLRADLLAITFQQVGEAKDIARKEYTLREACEARHSVIDRRLDSLEEKA